VDPAILDGDIAGSTVSDNVNRVVYGRRRLTRSWLFFKVGEAAIVFADNLNHPISAVSVFVGPASWEIQIFFD
jgi:hypothetical protein